MTWYNNSIVFLFLLLYLTQGEYSEIWYDSSHTLAMSKYLWYTEHMKVFLMLLFWALLLWPILSWITFYASGWYKWQKLYGREVTNDTDMAAAVGLKKF